MKAGLGVDGAYSAGKSVKKGVFHGILSVLPAASCVLAAALQAPSVMPAIEHAWPALPVSAIVGVLVAMLNWWKNAGGK